MLKKFHRLLASSVAFELPRAVYISYPFVCGLFFSLEVAIFFPTVYFQIISRLYDLVNIFLFNGLDTY